MHRFAKDLDVRQGAVEAVADFALHNHFKVTDHWFVLRVGGVEVDKVVVASITWKNSSKFFPLVILRREIGWSVKLYFLEICGEVFMVVGKDVLHTHLFWQMNDQLLLILISVTVRHQQVFIVAFAQNWSWISNTFRTLENRSSTVFRRKIFSWPQTFYQRRHWLTFVVWFRFDCRIII